MKIADIGSPSSAFAGTIRRLRSRRRWVIDPKLQYTLIASAGALMLCSLLLFYAIASKASEQFTVQAMKLDAGSREILTNRFNETLQSFKISLAVGYVGVTLLFAFVALQQTNRLAGPIYNLKRKMRLLREEGELQPVRFRNKDMFQDLGDEYNLLVEYLKVKGFGKRE